MTDIGRYAVFKPVPGGYVYRRPTVWLFGSGDHYLVNEVQKAEILATITSSSRPVLWMMGLSWIAFSLLLGAVLWLCAYRSGYYDRGLTGGIAMIAVALSIYPALLASRQMLLRRLWPILATLPPTNERITNLEERAAIAKAAPTTTLSPTRRRVARIASVVVVAATIAGMVSRAIDMHEMNQSILVTAYVANVNLVGLLNVLTIVAFGALYVTLGRRLSHM